MKTHLLNGDVMTIPLADKSVHCIVTSPPYWGLRSYSTGDNKSLELGSEPLHDCGGWVTGADCGVCFVCHVRQYARELWRVLRDDGTFFLNLGDSYNGSGGAGGDYNSGGLKDGQPKFSGRNVSTLKPKDLCGIPWRTALALQADGWYLRSDIIWHKPNPMPESVTDRPTKSHEYLFLLSKRKKYFYDADAGGRNRRTVWTIATAPYSGAHFATFPPALVEPCIKAGTSERGCCPVCGSQWARVVDRTAMIIDRSERTHELGRTRTSGTMIAPAASATTGWQPTCDCMMPAPDGSRVLCVPDPIPCTVFDPFSGSGTTVTVANQLGRVGIGLDLSLDYIELAKERTGLAALDAWQNGIDATEPVDLGPMFEKVSDQ